MTQEVHSCEISVSALLNLDNSRWCEHDVIFSPILKPPIVSWIQKERLEVAAEYYIRSLRRLDYPTRMGEGERSPQMMSPGAALQICVFQCIFVIWSCPDQ